MPLVSFYLSGYLIYSVQKSISCFSCTAVKVYQPIVVLSEILVIKFQIISDKYKYGSLPFHHWFPSYHCCVIQPWHPLPPPVPEDAFSPLYAGAEAADAADPADSADPADAADDEGDQEKYGGERGVICLAVVGHSIV